MKPLGISNTSKASSIIALALLLLSGTAGILAVAPTVVAASSPTITLSASSGSPPLGSTWWGLQVPATNITVTGTGFPSGQTGIEVGLISTSSVVTSSTVLSNYLCLDDLSLVTAAGNTACNTIDLPGGSTATQGYVSTGDAGYQQVTADANGYFQSVFQTPLVAGSPDVTYNIAATYSTSSGYVVSNSVPFSVTPTIAVVNDYSGANSGKYNDRVDLLAAGFSATETIQLLPSTGLFVTAPWGGTSENTFTVDQFGSTWSQGLAAGVECGTATTFGSGVSNGGCDFAFVGDHHSGSVTVQFIGVNSGNTASTTFSVTPSIEFQFQGKTTFALPASAGTGYFVGHGFAKSESIPQGSLSIGGVTTLQSSITATTAGSFGPVAFTYTSSLPAGVNTATFDGITFSFANQNIVAPPTLESFQDQQEISYGAPIVATTTSISFAQQDSSTNHEGHVAYLFGSCTGGAAACFGGGSLSHETTVLANATSVGTYSTALSGFPTTATTLESITSASHFNFHPGYGTGGSICVTAATCNGVSNQVAYWFGFDVPNSYGGSSTSTETLNAESNSPPSTSLTITMTADLYFISTSIAAPPGSEAACGACDPYPTNIADNTGTTFTIHVTGFNDTDTSANVYVGSTFWTSCSTTTFTDGTGTCSLGTHTLPDVASGSYTVWVNGTAKANYGSDSLNVAPVAGLVSLASTLNVSPGSIDGLLTASGAGIHGLAANTKYTVEYSGANMTTFKSTSTGQVPPGVEFVVPPGTSGNHIVDIVNSAGVSALFGQQLTSLGQYPNLTIFSSNSLTLAPTSGNVGSSVSMSGSGLGANTQYYVWVPLFPGSTTYASYTSFTSTATGSIPSGSGSFTWPLMPTDVASCTASTTAFESGTLVNVWAAAKSSDIGSTSPSAPVGSAQFFLEAALGFASSSASAGGSVSYTATGLCASTGYNIIFNYALSSLGTTYTGTTVGSFVSNSNGGATGTFTVPPSAAQGAYEVQLTRVGGPTSILGVLSAAPSLSVGPTSVSGVGTSTFTATGTPSESTVNGQPTLSGTWTNAYTGSLGVYMWVDVMNAAGQTVGVYLGSATAASGSSVTIAAALFNLPSGTYTATVFLTTTSGTVVSKTSTASFSI